LAKKQKGKPRKKDSPLLKNNITQILWPQKPVVYCSYTEAHIGWPKLETFEKRPLLPNPGVRLKF
jgi:hypothetical protein